MKDTQHQLNNMSAVATILLGLASFAFAAAQTSSFKDPMTGEPIQLIHGSEVHRKTAEICPEAVDSAGETYFHPTLDSDVGAVCTNSNDYPQLWKEIPVMPGIPQYLSSTGAECCEKFYGRHGVPLEQCFVKDVCVASKWHVSRFKLTTCTNSGDYPDSWNDPKLSVNFLFETAEKCCQKVKDRTGQACDIRDVNEPWDCNKWHLAIEKGDNDDPLHKEGTCTNSGVLHEVWATYEEHYIFPDYQTCCENFLIPDEDCHKADACGPPTKPPSRPPTPVPTPAHRPTQKPSDSPTKRPSDKPVADVTETCTPGGTCSAGSSCAVGEVSCCGQTYDSMTCECISGSWTCLVNEACSMPCVPTNSPTTNFPSYRPYIPPTSQPVDTTTTTTTPATTTTTITHSTTPETTTSTSTSTSTTTTTTISNPGDMELNSGSLGSPSGAPTSVCSLHTKKRACEGAKAQKCDWDRTAMTCIQEADDDEEMEPNSESATADLQGCASLYKRKAKCQKNAACTWTRAKSIKDRCTPVAT